MLCNSVNARAGGEGERQADRDKSSLRAISHSSVRTHTHPCVNTHTHAHSQAEKRAEQRAELARIRAAFKRENAALKKKPHVTANDGPTVHDIAQPTSVMAVVENGIRPASPATLDAGQPTGLHIFTNERQGGVVLPAKAPVALLLSLYLSLSLSLSLSLPLSLSFSLSLSLWLLILHLYMYR